MRELQKRYPLKPIEVWSFDEPRVGIKPIIRKVWASIGERPSSIVYHRYEWVYLYGFVNPLTGKTQWFIIPIVNIEWLNLVVENLAKQTGAGQAKIILTRSGQSRLTEERKSGCSIRNLCKIFTTLLSLNRGGDNPAKTQSR